jgi:hypothetical protein
MVNALKAVGSNDKYTVYPEARQLAEIYCITILVYTYNLSRGEGFLWKQQN